MPILARRHLGAEAAEPAETCYLLKFATSRHQQVFCVAMLPDTIRYRENLTLRRRWDISLERRLHQGTRLW